MCTCLFIQSKNTYFGRTLDLDDHFMEEVVITPRNFSVALRNGGNLQTKYAILGMASVLKDYPLYFDACNEKGLAMAGLHFCGNAVYFPPKAEKENLPTYEMMLYLLGNYTSVAELRPFLEKLNLSDTPFSPELPLAPLHFMIADEKECIVIEQTKEGLAVYENETGVMTNNPPFPHQLANLQKFANLTPKYKAPKKTEENVSFASVGYGSLGLPGDDTSPSRFVKAAFLQKTATKEKDEQGSITQFFHILDAVSMVKGSVLTETGAYDSTIYTSCMNTTKGIYYYKTYGNNQISAVRLTEDNCTAPFLTRYPLNLSQNICYHN